MRIKSTELGRHHKLHVAHEPELAGSAHGNFMMADPRMSKVMELLATQPMTTAEIADATHESRKRTVFRMVLLDHWDQVRLGSDYHWRLAPATSQARATP
jgi:hypothetical protein